VPDRAAETFDRLLQALDQLAVEAERAGDMAVREWTALAQLHAIDFGEQVGLLLDAESRPGWARRVGPISRIEMPSGAANLEYQTQARLPTNAEPEVHGPHTPRRRAPGNRA
jgi:hypothetical protein